MLKIFKINLSKDRTFGLDVLRFLAITLVLIEHGRNLIKPISIDTEIMKLGGYWGVELFFVLSGFLIGRILLRVYESETDFDFEKLFSFWKRRWYRTLPNYYLILILNLILAYTLASTHLPFSEYVPFFFFFQNIYTKHPWFFGEAWSLAVEEWFYISFPLLLFLTNKTVGNILSEKRKFIGCILIVLFFSNIMRMIVVSDSDPLWDRGVRKIVLLRLDSILTGVLFAWFNYYYREFFYKYRYKMLIIAMILLSMSFYNYYADKLYIGEQNSFYSKTFFFLLTSTGFALCLPFADSVKKMKKRSFSGKFITLISIISYSIYLTHYSVVLRLLRKFDHLNNSIYTCVLLYILYLGLSVIVSVLLYKFFEKPFMELRDRLKIKQGNSVE
jgi:peptidoglycan/LPS O-acetylase OafA/YrhL